MNQDAKISELKAWAERRAMPPVVDPEANRRAYEQQRAAEEAERWRTEKRVKFDGIRVLLNIPWLARILGVGDDTKQVLAAAPLCRYAAYGAALFDAREICALLDGGAIPDRRGYLSIVVVRGPADFAQAQWDVHRVAGELLNYRGQVLPPRLQIYFDAARQRVEGLVGLKITAEMQDNFGPDAWAAEGGKLGKAACTDLDACLPIELGYLPMLQQVVWLRHIEPDVAEEMVAREAASREAARVEREKEAERHKPVVSSPQNAAAEYAQYLREVVGPPAEPAQAPDSQAPVAPVEAAPPEATAAEPAESAEAHGQEVEEAEEGA